MKFIKNTLFIVFILTPAIPLLFWLIWNDKMQEFGDHVDYEELPLNWTSLSDEEKQRFLDDCARDHLNNHCEATAWLVEDDEGE